MCAAELVPQENPTFQNSHSERTELWAFRDFVAPRVEGNKSRPEQEPVQPLGNNDLPESNQPPRGKRDGDIRDELLLVARHTFSGAGYCKLLVPSRLPLFALSHAVFPNRKDIRF